MVPKAAIQIDVTVCRYWFASFCLKRILSATRRLSGIIWLLKLIGLGVVHSQPW